ncbi:hypothetical protein Ddye_013552 [Dipteronia dyeriana]|uniref:Uncharacterized protein n=1 Tax=Dipteronia dyeriana TaxID=168575 RepID=A0AAE0CJR5_9ROSI|nr:hypothetical protein Ddye_013552 [Dipteronia dyeriana]
MSSITQLKFTSFLLLCVGSYFEGGCSRVPALSNRLSSRKHDRSLKHGAIRDASFEETVSEEIGLAKETVGEKIGTADGIASMEKGRDMRDR